MPLPTQRASHLCFCYGISNEKKAGTYYIQYSVSSRFTLTYSTHALRLQMDTRDKVAYKLIVKKYTPPGFTIGEFEGDKKEG